jgi:catechol 2,3-dioxygenase-like lactoylglutathione lyase family enzyme
MSRSALHHHVGLSVADLDEAEHWYGRAFGMDEVVERVELPEPPVRTVVLRAPNGLRIELIERAGSQGRSFADPLEAASTRGFGHWALEVDDLAQTYGELTSLGAEPVWPPADGATRGTRFAYVRDPEGNLLELIQPPSGGEDLVDQ